jgi:hypothetical protein
MTHLVDKVEVKHWVANRIGAEHIIPTLGVYERPADVPLQTLPRPCILKPTHASGHVLMLKGGTGEPTPDHIQSRLAGWQKIEHYLVSGEPQYRDIQPRIICEPLIGADQVDLPDYKFFCFDGKPVFVQVDLKRHIRHVRSFYDVQWKPQDFTLRYPKSDHDVPCPSRFDKMLDIASTLSVGFSFVRVDLYAVERRIYFGELTFHPESGNAPFSNFEADLELGKRFSQ